RQNSPNAVEPSSVSILNSANLFLRHWANS
ncbi:MAG: hypothetical protein ACI8P0_005189, partial [Planctomycetaceae bacterium]